MITLDTNVLVRYFARDDAAQFPLARKVMNGLSADEPGFICLTVMAEFAWVLRRSRGLSVDEMLDMIDLLLRTQEFEIEDGESVDEAARLARSGADFADALIDATARLYGSRETVTFDRKAADRLGWRLLA